MLRSVQDQAVSWDLRSILHNDWPFVLLGVVIVALVIFLTTRRKP